MTEQLTVTRAAFDSWWEKQHVALFEILAPEEKKRHLDNRWGWLVSEAALQKYKEEHHYD